MRFVAVLFLALQTKIIVVSSDEKEHVHFKIYVPEVIKHHTHTHTIFIHVREPKKKVAPKKNSHLESWHEDWSSYSNYNEADEQGERNEGERSLMKAHGGHPYRDEDDKGYAMSHEGLLTVPGRPPLRNEDSYDSYQPENLQPPISHYDDYQGHLGQGQHLDGHPVPLKGVFRNGVVGYSYPPQYQVHENVVENTPEDSGESYEDTQEEGYRKRHRSETAHLYTNELSNFYDDKHEESNEALSKESEEVEKKTNRGSYRYVGDNYRATRMASRV